MDSKIKIVKATSGDWRQYKKLRTQSVVEFPKAFAITLAESRRISDAEWEKQLSNKYWLLFFAVLQNDVVGMIGINLHKRECYKHLANIGPLYVLEKYQGQGIGSALMKHVIAILKKKKIVKIDSTVNGGQLASLRIHLKHGFKQVGISHKGYRIGKKFYNQHILEKML